MLHQAHAAPAAPTFQPWLVHHRLPHRRCPLRQAVTLALYPNAWGPATQDDEGAPHRAARVAGTCDQKRRQGIPRYNRRFPVRAPHTDAAPSHVRCASVNNNAQEIRKKAAVKKRLGINFPSQS